MGPARTERVRSRRCAALAFSARSARRKVQPADDPDAFLALVDLVNREGVPGTFAKTRYRYLTIADFTYWVSRCSTTEGR